MVGGPKSISRDENFPLSLIVSNSKDPICGMTVDESTALSAERDEETFGFCSDHCRQKFLSTTAITKPEAKQQGKVIYTLLV